MFDQPDDFCRLVLIRHPELDAAHAECAIGGGPADLSRRGRTQVLQWLELLGQAPLSAVFASPQPQCAEPAKGLADGKKLELTIEPRLRDQDMGSWQGRAWQDIAREEGSAVQAFFSEFGDSKAPGGESLGDAVERMLEWWAETMPKVAGQALVVVMPGSLLSGFAAAMLGMRLSRCVSLNLPHGGIGVLDAFQNGVRISTWNPTAAKVER